MNILNVSTIPTPILFTLSLSSISGLIGAGDFKKGVQGGSMAIVRKGVQPLHMIYNGPWYITGNVVSYFVYIGFFIVHVIFVVTYQTVRNHCINYP